MPNDAPEENQDEAVMLPQRVNYPLKDEDAAKQNEPSIGQRIMQLVPTQVVPDEPMPLRGIDGQQLRDNKPQVEAKSSIGQRIVQLGKQGLPPFDIQDGRPVWRQRPETLTKPSIGQRIMGLVPNWRPQPAPTLSDGSRWWDTQIRPLPNPKPSEIREPEPILNFNPANSPRMQLLNTQAGINYPLRSLRSTSTSSIGDKGTEWQPKFVDAPLSPAAKTFSTRAASSGSWNKSTPSFGGTQETLQKPLDLNEFAAFLGDREQGNSASDDQNYFAPSSTKMPQTEARGLPEAQGRAAGAAMGMAAGEGLASTLSAAARHSVGQKPPVKGSVGKGGENDPVRVKAIQHLLNEAIEVGHLSGPPLEENGKVTDDMLRLLERYQKANNAPKEALLTDRSLTTRKLKENPLEDTRWDGYDETIKGEVDSFNKSLKQEYPDFPGLDWRLVKAMLWQESGGPGRGKEWKTWPMQIGRRKADLAIQDVISGGYNTKLIALKSVRDEITNAYRQHKMTPSLNIRAAVIYLCARAISGFEPETDAPKLQEQLGERQSLSTFADKHGTTVENLKMLNPRIIGKERSLKPTTLLTYQKTKPVWSPWERAVHNYNSEITDPNYVKKVLRYYEAIKKRWSQESTARQR